MLVPAGLATLASWTVGLAVSVLAVGFKSYNIPTGTGCTPIPLMPRYGVVTLATSCLVCTLLVVAINMKLVQYFRKVFVVSITFGSKNISQPQRTIRSASNDKRSLRSDCRQKLSVLYRCNQQRCVVLNKFRSERIGPGDDEKSGLSRDVNLIQETHQRQSSLRNQDVFTVKIEHQQTFPPTASLPRTSQYVSCKTHYPSHPSDSHDINFSAADVYKLAFRANKDRDNGCTSPQIQGRGKTNDKKYHGSPQSQIMTRRLYPTEKCLSPQSQDKVKPCLNNMSCCSLQTQEKLRSAEIKEIRSFDSTPPALEASAQETQEPVFMFASHALASGVRPQRGPVAIRAEEETRGRSSPKPPVAIRAEEETRGRSSPKPPVAIRAEEDTRGRSSPKPPVAIRAEEETRGRSSPKPPVAIRAEEETRGRSSPKPPVAIGAEEETRGRSSPKPPVAIRAEEDTRGRSSPKPPVAIGAEEETRGRSSPQPPVPLQPLRKSCRPPQHQATVQPRRRNKTILITLVILSLWACGMNLPLTLYLFMSGSLDTIEAKKELLFSLKGSIPVIFIVAQAVLNPCLYLFRLIDVKDVKRKVNDTWRYFGLCFKCNR
ncbi:hypothetical protein RRG08_063876 [Elysia crispata]|uniref:Uncharacterized protein n=1 Tax=Elysia crispata TaxID=231223 RepID=A0AAE1D7M9_9GAST|nr:hypothetical protein RRG08_063876 [Elysia crispata]